MYPSSMNTVFLGGVDFPTEVINYELPVSTATTRFIDIKVPIIDDKIDELQQTFAVELNVSGDLVVDTSFRNFTLIEINDDDGMKITYIETENGIIFSFLFRHYFGLGIFFLHI